MSDAGPSLGDLDYNADRTLRYFLALNLEADTDDPFADAERIKVAVPDITGDDLLAATAIGRVSMDLADLSSKCNKAWIGRMRMLGLGGEATVGEVLASVPDEWSEADDVRRLLVLREAARFTHEIIEAMLADSLDLDAAMEWVMSRGLSVPLTDDDAQNT